MEKRKKKGGRERIMRMEGMEREKKGRDKEGREYRIYESINFMIFSLPSLLSLPPSFLHIILP